MNKTMYESTNTIRDVVTVTKTTNLVRANKETTSFKVTVPETVIEWLELKDGGALDWVLIAGEGKVIVEVRKHNES